MLLGEVVHPGARGAVEGVLLAAVQHDDQRHRLAGVAGRDVEVVAAGPRRLRVAEVPDLAAGRGRGGLGGGPRGGAGTGEVAAQAGQAGGDAARARRRVQRPPKLVEQCAHVGQDGLSR